jgi:hypothetical protein
VAEENWSFLTKMFNEISRRDPVRSRYSERTWEQATYKVIDFIKDATDDAVRAVVFNMIGSGLRDVASHMEGKLEDFEKGVGDGGWTDERKGEWQSQYERFRNLDRVNKVYNTADAIRFSPLRRDEDNVYAVIKSLSEMYSESQELKRIKVASDIYKNGTDWLGKAVKSLETITDFRNGREKPWENPTESESGKNRWDKVYNVALMTEKTSEYMPFWVPALYLATRYAIIAEAERLNKKGQPR